MAKCSVCGKDVGMSYELFEGKKYCDDCYRMYVAPEEQKKTQFVYNENGASAQNEKDRPSTPMVAQAFFVFACAIWILGLIGSIYFGSELRDGTYIIIGLVLTFASGCIPMGFSTVIRLLAEIAWNTRRRK